MSTYRVLLVGRICRSADPRTGKHDEVRADAGLSVFSSTDQAAILTQLKYERSAELWYEGRRWQDMRYYEIIPDRWAQVNKTKGIHRRWPVSQREKDNMGN